MSGKPRVRLVHIGAVLRVLPVRAKEIGQGHQIIGRVGTPPTGSDLGHHRPELLILGPQVTSGLEQALTQGLRLFQQRWQVVVGILGLAQADVGVP